MKVRRAQQTPAVPGHLPRFGPGPVSPRSPAVPNFMKPENWDRSCASAAAAPDWPPTCTPQTRRRSSRSGHALDFGNVAVNNPDAGIMNAPYGGRKGYEHGREGLRGYLQLKPLRIQYAR